MDDAEFPELLASKLANPDVGDTLFFGQHVGVARQATPFELHVRILLAEVTAPLDDKTLAAHPLPGTLTNKSLQGWSTAVQSFSRVGGSAWDQLFLKAQGWRHEWLDARRWRRCLDAFDSWQAWLDLAQEWEGEGRLVEANAAIAAARWLDPPASEEWIPRIVAGRSPRLPARFLAQPAADFRTRDFHRRHWQAWDMKTHAFLDLPTLIANESDENFSIRTRIYRSLGQRPHPASIQVLQEATFDPHPFARAQATRSLGWCAAPTALPRLDELKSDADDQVRRAAEQAWQRIVGYWMYFGEWADIMADPRRLADVIDALLDRNLLYLAHDLLETLLDRLDDKLLKIREELWELEPVEEWGRERDYAFWFDEAARQETAVRGAKAGASTLRGALEKGDLATRMKALLVVSWKGLQELVPQVESLVSNPEPVGWAARRALRAMNRGTMEQRSRSLL